MPEQIALGFSGCILKGAVTMATTRFHYGDDFTLENYREIEAFPPNPAGTNFAVAIRQLLNDRVCCVPVAQVEQSNATTIGLGDAFVSGLLPALCTSEPYSKGEQ